MSKRDIYEMIDGIKERKEKDVNKYNLAEKMLIQVEEDILFAKKRDEKFLSSVSTLDPEIEEIYEERRKLYFDYLDKNDEAKDFFKTRRDKVMREYDKEIDELEKRLKDYEDD